MNTKNLFAAVGLLALFAGAGCAVETAEQTDEMAGVDAALLENALANQRTLEASGLRLIGRVWVASDGYGELYERKDGESLAMFFARSGTKEAVDETLMPQDGDTLESYAARAARGQSPRYLKLDDESGPNVAVFDPESTSVRGGDGVATTTEALVNENCPKSDYDTLCSLRWGYEGSTANKTWDLVDQTTARSQSGRGTSYITTLCADRGNATFDVTASGGGLVSTSVTVPQGMWAISRQAVSRGTREECGWICAFDCDTIDFFNRANVTVTGTPAAGGNFHSCGKVLNRGDVRTDGCDNIISGPPFRPAIRRGFLDSSGKLLLSDCGKFCEASCKQACAGQTGPGWSACMSA
ncbi:MAG TPA: hypothetical protein VFZ53_10810, partial [Polyangiaceae bacterium]